MCSLPFPRSAALALVLPPMSIYQDLKNYSRKRGISIYSIQELLKIIEAHGSFGVCHDMSHVITPIFK